jgi:hypothetical protein
VFNPMMFNSGDAGAGPLYEVHAIVVASATVCINGAPKRGVPEQTSPLSAGSVAFLVNSLYR